MLVPEHREMERGADCSGSSKYQNDALLSCACGCIWVVHTGILVMSTTTHDYKSDGMPVLLAQETAQ